MYYLYKGKIKHHADLTELLREELKSLPLGSMKVNRGNFYYQAIKGKEKNITKDIPLIQQYCRKRLVIALLKQLERKRSLPAHEYVEIPIKDLINILPKSYRGFPLHDYFHSQYKSWLKLRGPANELFSQDLKYPAKQNNFVRSKSELIIANHLEAHNIPFIYEMPLNIQGKTIYPDFVIICPYTGKLKLWEHFGFLGDSQYEKKMKDKKILYHKLGFTLFEDIIYTYESDITDSGRIEDIIEDIILNPKV